MQLKTKNLLKSRFLAYNLVFVLSAILLTPRYGTIDEFFISDLINGNYTGENEFILVFIQPLIGFLFQYMTYIMGVKSLYSIIIAEVLIVSLIIFERNLQFQSKKADKVNAIFLLQAIFILITFVLLPTYTSAAVLIAIINLININIIKYPEKPLELILSWIFIAIAISLRLEVIFIVTLFLVIILIINLVKGTRNSTSKYLIGTALLVPILIVNQIILYFSSSSSWNSYFLWNSFRHQLHNRIAQFRLDEILIPGGWKPEEHNLFVDWAYGDPEIFNLNWIRIGYDYTSGLRGLQSFFNLDWSYFLFNIERYSVIGNWFLLFILQIILTLILGSKLGLLKNFIVSTLVWVPSFAIFTYSAFFLLLPQRVILPLLLLPLLLMISVQFKEETSKNSHKSIWAIIFLMLVLYSNQILNISRENRVEKQSNDLLLGELKAFDSKAVYLIPRCNNPYFSENPYNLNEKSRPINILNVGCWETFSPHWNKRKANFGLTSNSIYDDLFKEDVYWLGNYVPDTSINIENLLRNKGETNFSREVVKELSGDYVLFKFSKNIS
jgi:hypothetical protein